MKKFEILNETLEHPLINSRPAIVREKDILTSTDTKISLSSHLNTQRMIQSKKQTEKLWHSLLGSHTGQSQNTSKPVQPCWTRADLHTTNHKSRRSSQMQAAAIAAAAPTVAARITNYKSTRACSCKRNQVKGHGETSIWNHSCGMFSWVKLSLHSQCKKGEAPQRAFNLLLTTLFLLPSILAAVTWISFYPASSFLTTLPASRRNSIYDKICPNHMKPIQLASVCAFLNKSSHGCELEFLMSRNV